MSHRPIQIKDLRLALAHKLCFEEFNETIYSGNRIAIIGQNGSGKSTLLKILQGLAEPSEGKVIVPNDVIIGYVPQLIEQFDSLSGGQRFNEKLTQALAHFPNVLLLDEPTNHLDRKNRNSLIRMLQSFEGTLLIITHDVELLQLTIDTIWHIDQGKIHVFTGKYEDYKQKLANQYQLIQEELDSIAKQKKEAHQSLMQEQVRAKHSRIAGEKNIERRKWATVVSSAKARRGEETFGRKKSDLKHKREGLVDRLAELRLPEVIKPNFSIEAGESGRVLVSIQDGCIGFTQPILTSINLSITAGDRIAIMGDNASGKSTLIRAILNDPQVQKTGVWNVIKQDSIGYLDQHYSTLDPKKSVLDFIQLYAPNWSHAEIRKHLNTFLFRKNEEVNATISNLSGGEKARLSLAQIAAITPKLLILDEITNNLDLETRDHVIQVLKAYPGALLVVSHDIQFLSEMNVTTSYKIKAAANKTEPNELVTSSYV